MKYKRVLIKLSGEALKGDSSQIFDPELLKNVAKVIREVSLEGAEICIVVGAGNIWRGKLAETIGIESATADYMGMYHQWYGYSFSFRASRFRSESYVRYQRSSSC